MKDANNKTTTTLSIIVAIIICAAGIALAVYAIALNPSHSETGAKTESPHGRTTHESNRKDAPLATDIAEAAIAIKYGNEGFAQPIYEVNSGELVRVENNSDREMYFAAGEHEHHDVDSSVDLGVIEPGKFSVFKAPQAGTYLFHNHDNDSHTGQLIVR